MYIVTAAGAGFDPLTSLSTLQTWAVAALGLACLVVGLRIIFGPAGKGQVRKSWDMSLSALIGLLPIFIGLGFGAVAFANGLFGSLF